MGVLYERFDNGEILREVSTSLREKVIGNYYRKTMLNFLKL